VCPYLHSSHLCWMMQFVPSAQLCQTTCHCQPLVFCSKKEQQCSLHHCHAHSRPITITSATAVKLSNTPYHFGNILTCKEPPNIGQGYATNLYLRLFYNFTTLMLLCCCCHGVVCGLTYWPWGTLNRHGRCIFTVRLHVM